MIYIWDNNKSYASHEINFISFDEYKHHEDLVITLLEGNYAYFKGSVVGKTNNIRWIDKFFSNVLCIPLEKWFIGKRFDSHKSNCDGIWRKCTCYLKPAFDAAVALNFMTPEGKKTLMPDPPSSKPAMVSSDGNIVDIEDKKK